MRKTVSSKKSPQFQTKRMKSGAKRVIPDRGSPTGNNAKPRPSSGFTAKATWKAFAKKSQGGYRSTMAKGNKSSVNLRNFRGK